MPLLLSKIYPVPSFSKFFKEGKRKAEFFSSCALEKFFSRVSIFAPSPFDKGGSRGIFISTNQNLPVDAPPPT